MKRESIDPSDLHDEAGAYYDDGRSRYANGADHDAWGEPDLSLLGTGRRPAPPFPLSILGDGWCDWVEMRARGASAPIDYVAVSLLSCVGGALANVRWALAGSDWAEPPILWCGNVGDPSSSKSPAQAAVFNLVRHAEEMMAADFADVQADYVTRKLAAEAREEAWKSELRTLVQGGQDAPPMPADAVAPDEPVRPRIRVMDATTEKLGALAAGLPRGLLLFRDELSGFIGSLDRYSGKGADRPFALEMYGGGPFIVDRQKNGGSAHIRHLSVGLLGSIQPDKLAVIIDGPQDGFAARFLWAWPETQPDFRINRERTDDGPMREAFVRLTNLEMVRDRFGNLEPLILTVTDRGVDLLEAFSREAKRRSEESDGLFSGALGKARGQTLRLATIIDHLWWSARPKDQEPEVVSAGAMQAAINLMNEYFIPMAERVFGDASIPMAEYRAMHLAKHLRRLGLKTFKARDLRRAISGPVRDAADMDEACEGLVEGNLIRLKRTPSGPQGGRPSKVYEVNPVLARRLA